MATGPYLKGHKFIVIKRCPNIIEDPEILKGVPEPVIQVLKRYIYTDIIESEEDNQVNLTPEELYQLWKVAQKVGLARLEAIVRLTIRKSPTKENAVLFAVNAYKYDLKGELHSIVQVIQQNQESSKEQLSAYPDLISQIITASPQEYPQQEVTIPPSKLDEEFTAAMHDYYDMVLTITDKQGNKKSIKTHKAIICNSSEYFKAHMDFDEAKKKTFDDI